MQHISLRALPWQCRVCVCRACNLDADGSHRRVHGAAHNFVHVTLHALPLSVLEAPLGCLWGPLHRLPARRRQWLLSSRGRFCQLRECFCQLSGATAWLTSREEAAVCFLRGGGGRLPPPSASMYLPQKNTHSHVICVPRIASGQGSMIYW
jgi:hypothetical protein